MDLRTLLFITFTILNALAPLILRKNITPLHLSAMYGHCKIAQLLLDHKASLALENDVGMNALELAIFHQNKNVLEVKDPFKNKPFLNKISYWMLICFCFVDSNILSHNFYPCFR